MSDENNQRPAGNAPRGSSRNQPTNKQSRPKRGSTGSAAPRKYMTQQQKEAMYQRWLYIGLGVAAAVIVLALGAGALWQYRIMPNQVVASVNGQEITRRDYWKYQNISLYNQARLYEELALQYTGQEQSQFLLYSAQLDAARKDVKGSTDVSEATLTQMIEDQLYIRAAEEQGVDMSMPVLRQQALNSFAPSDTPIVTPIPSPTLIPERAEWATQTAEAIQTQEAEQAAMLGTPMATPVGVGTPGATPVVDPTPDMATITSTAESDYQAFVNDVLPEAGLTEEQYLNLFAKPLVARDHVNAEIVAGVPQSAPQVDVAHILVNTEELANEIEGKLQSGELTFQDAVAIYSQDTATSTNDGKLGWVAEGELPEELDAVIFTMQEGDVSAPIQSSYGWHIVQVIDTDEDRALTTSQYDAAVARAKSDMLDTQRANAEIKSDFYNPTPTATSTVFTPPVNAPTPVVATPVMAPDLSATPIAGPTFIQASPEASPVGSPVASPSATP